MPFIGPDPADASRWSQVTTVDLRQLPVTRRWKVYFEVIREFGYTDLDPDLHDGARPGWTAATVQHLVPRGMETDLASVPPFLWGVIASYGRQTLPALLHDMLCLSAAQEHQPAAYRRRVRREADRLFRHTLHASGSGLLRRWLMWAAVRLGGRVAVAVCVGLGLVAGVVGAATGFTWQPAVWALVIAAVGALVTAAVAAFESRRRMRGELRSDAPVADADEFTRPRFEPRAFAGVLAAGLITLVAAVPIVVVGVATTVTELLVGLGERSGGAAPAPGAGVAPRTGAAAGAPPPPSPGAPSPEASSAAPVGATARITWAPLVEPGSSTVNANPAPADL